MTQPDESRASLALAEWMMFDLQQAQRATGGVNLW
jgi:hypothetical protein